LQQRIENTRVGRYLITAFLAVVLLSVLVTNLQTSEVKRVAGKYSDPVVNAFGLDQRWSMFAPNPRKETVAMDATVYYRDGSKKVWLPPKGRPVIGSLWDHRWVKLVENEIQDDQRDRLWRLFAEWIARDVGEKDGQKPIRVELTRRWYHLNAPGQKLPNQPELGIPNRSNGAQGDAKRKPDPAKRNGGPWQQILYYQLDLETGQERGSGLPTPADQRPVTRQEQR